MATLRNYRAKRMFTETAEPKGAVSRSKGPLLFVLQRHQAHRLHYDFRLQLQGVLKSWALPKGPSMNPADRRLAIQVEDHPLDYADFEGEIPKGNYGAGMVEIWDRGSFTPVDGRGKKISEARAVQNAIDGELKFQLCGQYLNGGFVLVRTGDRHNWLLIKLQDEHAFDEPYDAEDLRPVSHRSKKKTKKNADHTVNTLRVSCGGKGEGRAGIVKLTHINKIYWPVEKITKGQMLDYYDRMAKWILPYLKDRPLSLKRNVNGIRGKSFYHKDAGGNAPSYVVTERVISGSSGKVIDYIVCNNKATLLYVANLGCIEMNPWNSTRRKPDHPTYMVIDIDPSDGNSFSQVIETAMATCEVLEKAGATYNVKTSGATGLHVYVPLAAKYEYGTVRDFAHIVALLTQELVPGFTTLERTVHKRGQRIYIDFLQNSRGQTLASAYSLRPVPGAQVSAPLLPKELRQGLEPARFNIFNMQKRVEQLGDVFCQVLGKGNNIKSCLRNLGY